MNFQIFNLFDNSDALPEQNINCKFVIIETLTDRWFIFGPLETYRYHAQLIHKFCALNDVTCAWVKTPDLVEIIDPDTEIKGGGIIVLEFDKQTIELKGHSTAYGKFDKTIIEQFVDESDNFQDFEVLIGT